MKALTNIQLLSTMEKGTISIHPQVKGLQHLFFWHNGFEGLLSPSGTEFAKFFY